VACGPGVRGTPARVAWAIPLPRGLGLCGPGQTTITRLPSKEFTQLARRLGEASVDKGMGRRIVLWGVGGSLGLVLVVAGAVGRSTATEAAGVVILIVTLLVVGLALIAVQVYGDLREHRLAQGRHLHSPSR